MVGWLYRCDLLINQHGWFGHSWPSGLPRVLGKIGCYGKGVAMSAHLLSTMLAADSESSKRAEVPRMQDPSTLQHRRAASKLVVSTPTGRYKKWERPDEKKFLSKNGRAFCPGLLQKVSWAEIKSWIKLQAVSKENDAFGRGKKHHTSLFWNWNVLKSHNICVSVVRKCHSNDWNCITEKLFVAFPYYVYMPFVYNIPVFT